MIFSDDTGKCDGFFDGMQDMRQAATLFIADGIGFLQATNAMNHRL